MKGDRAEFERLLATVLGELHMDLLPQQVGALYQHYELLKRWNQRMSLTSVRGLQEYVQRHIGESLTVARCIGPGDGAVVDIGSGAGFPGVPVATCWPNREVVLVESVGKKATFLNEATRGIRNVQVFSDRFEKLEGDFEWGAIRAVSAVDLGERLLNLVRRVAIVVSKSLAAGIVQEVGLLGVETHVIPWDAKTIVLTGYFGRST